MVEVVMESDSTPLPRPDVNNAVMDTKGGYRCLDEEMPQLRKMLIQENFENDEMAEKCFNYILNAYQEQPELIDRYIQELVDLVMALIRNSNVDRACHMMYILCKVRGVKVCFDIGL